MSYDSDLEEQGSRWLMKHGYIDDFRECPKCEDEKPVVEDVINGVDTVICEKCDYHYKGEDGIVE